MTEARMAYPDLRHPFEEKPINQAGSVTILYAGKTIELQQTLSVEDEGLWVTPEDLTRINGFELKPQGACFEDLCIPLKDHSPLLKQQAGHQWFDLVAFADSLEQPYVNDADNSVWSFGEIPDKRQSMMNDAMAPDFEVVDREGKVIRMSDYKGKKALIITWSSW
jgi:hypothetical protein